MRDKDFFWSVARKIVIAALLVSAVLLFLRTDYFFAAKRQGGVEASAAGTSAGTAVSASAEAAAMLLPRAVLVRFPDGSAMASAYDGENTEQAFRRFSAVLGEALGSAAAPEELTEEGFRGGMGLGCVYVDLGCVLPLGLLSDWLGAGGGGAADRSARTLYLGIEDDEAVLFFRDGDGGFLRCATATQAETLEARMGDFSAFGAHFAWEDPRLSGTDPYAVILEDMPELYAVSGASASDQADPERLMDAMGLNSYVASSYYDADGTLVLMEGGRTLRLSPDGTLYYRNSGGAAGTDDDIVAAVNDACRLARQSAGASGGDAELVFSGLEQGEGACTVYFDYAVAGVPVRQANSHTGTIVVSGGAVRWASMSLRRYTRSETPETVLTMPRAAAIASAKGGTPALVYVDSGDRATCIWVNE